MGAGDSRIAHPYNRGVLTTGVDIVEIDRVERAVARGGDRFLNRIYTEAEIALYRERPLGVSGAFRGQGSGDEGPRHRHARRRLA